MSIYYSYIAQEFNELYNYIINPYIILNVLIWLPRLATAQAAISEKK